MYPIGNINGYRNQEVVAGMFPLRITSSDSLRDFMLFILMD